LFFSETQCTVVQRPGSRARVHPLIERINERTRSVYCINAQHTQTANGDRAVFGHNRSRTKIRSDLESADNIFSARLAGCKTTTRRELACFFICRSLNSVLAGEGRRVLAPPCPRSTTRLQRSPVGRVESFRSWSSQLFRGRPGGRRHVRSGGRLSDALMWS